MICTKNNNASLAKCAQASSNLLLRMGRKGVGFAGKCPKMDTSLLRVRTKPISHATNGWQETRVSVAEALTAATNIQLNLQNLLSQLHPQHLLQLLWLYMEHLLHIRLLWHQCLRTQLCQQLNL